MRKYSLILELCNIGFYSFEYHGIGYLVAFGIMAMGILALGIVTLGIMS